MILNFKTYHKTMEIKVVWYWPKGRHTDQWGRLEIPEIDP